MGLSSLAVVLGIIQQVHSIDFQINQLYQRKFQIMSMGRNVNNIQMRAAQSPERSMVRVRLMDFATGEPRQCTGRIVNVPNPGGGFRVAETSPFGFPPGTTWDLAPASIAGLAKDRTGRILAAGAPPDASCGEGETFMSKEAAEALAKSYMQELSIMEKEIDMNLEQLKAQRQALQSQREEFTKYVGEGIKMAFKNNYA